MTRLDRGLYEVLITETLDAQLRDLGDRLEARRDGLRSAEAADRVALHLTRVIQKAVASVDDHERVAVSIALARRLINEIEASIGDADALPERPIEPVAVLHAISGRRPDGSADTIPEPLIPLLDTTLLTNAPGEPRVGNQVMTEILSADRINVVMAAAASPRCSARCARTASRDAICACSRRRTPARPRPAPSTPCASSAPRCASRTTRA
jgi:hypothetical protein